jgi:hypothetical protein
MATRQRDPHGPLQRGWLWTVEHLALRRFGSQVKPEITPPPIPTNPGTAPRDRQMNRSTAGNVPGVVNSKPLAPSGLVLAEARFGR